MKTENVYGVEMTPIQSMMFSKYISNMGIAMNTYTTAGRREIALDWLNTYHVVDTNNMVKPTLNQTK